MADTTGVVAGGLDARPLPASGYVRFRAVDIPSLGVVAELDGKVDVAGYGVHEVLDVEGAVGITRYKGRAPFRLTIPLLLDLDPHGTVEPVIAALERMHAIRDEVFSPAPTLIVEGLGVPHSYTRNPGLRWVLDGDPSWGDDVRHRAGGDGERSYIQLTVSVLGVPRARAVADGPANVERRYFHVQPIPGTPRTLRTIGRPLQMTWRQVRELNPRLPADPDRPLKAGTMVRVA